MRLILQVYGLQLATLAGLGYSRSGGEGGRRHPKTYTVVAVLGIAPAAPGEADVPPGVVERPATQTLGGGQVVRPPSRIHQRAHRGSCCAKGLQPTPKRYPARHTAPKRWAPSGQPDGVCPLSCSNTTPHGRDPHWPIPRGGAPRHRLWRRTPTRTLSAGGHRPSGQTPERLPRGPARNPLFDATR